MYMSMTKKKKRQQNLKVKMLNFPIIFIQNKILLNNFLKNFDF